MRPEEDIMATAMLPRHTDIPEEMLPLITDALNRFAEGEESDTDREMIGQKLMAIHETPEDCAGFAIIIL
jgi:hypothetical protein